VIDVRGTLGKGALRLFGRGAVRQSFAAAILVLLVALPARAQVDGHVSVIVDALPDIDEAAGRQSVVETRVRLFAERHDELGTHLRFTISGYVDGLIADRGYPAEAGLHVGPRGLTADAIARPADLFVDIVTRHFDLRAGAARLVWGRLDEFQPTDVVNPIDLSRFLMEGRSEARLPVGLVRARTFLPRSTTLEAVVVPHFRRGRFDQLDEPTSPFNLMRSSGIPDRLRQGYGGPPELHAKAEGMPYERVRDEPSGSESLQGGLRLTTTTARVDWSVSAYRGRRAFPILGRRSAEREGGSTLTAGTEPQPFVIRESFPRFTMIGADFETVRGLWGIRGEVAAFVEDELQSLRALGGVPGRSINGGIGIDRRAGDYRIAANVLWSRSDVDESDPAAQSFAGDEEVERTDLSLVLAGDRSFARETRTLRLFAVYDPAESTAFMRAIGAVSVRDNVWLEGSAGVFAGSSLDVIGRLTRRDFFYARLKVFF
jgi:hypothetical protein